MRPELITRRPVLAAVILIAGAVVYGLLCQPAFHTRGYPQLNPFWRAMPWLWILPAVISAVFDDNGRRRLHWLVLYGLATGVIDAGTVTGIVPRGMTFNRMLVGTAFWGPAHCVAAVLIERLAQRFLRKIRGFTDADRCHECGYLIRYLTVPRCPECGTAFDEQWIKARGNPLAPSSRPWRTRLTIGMLLVAVVGVPPLYEWVSLGLASQSGRTAARRDWADENAILYVPCSNIPYWRKKTWPQDPLSGLRMRHAFPTVVPQHGLEEERFQQAYNRVIEEELAKQGKAPITRYLLNDDELAQILNDASLRHIDELPFDIGHGVRIDANAEGLLVNGHPTELHANFTSMRGAVVDRSDGLLVLVAGNQVYVLLTDGTWLQFAHAANIDGHWTLH